MRAQQRDPESPPGSPGAVLRGPVCPGRGLAPVPGGLQEDLGEPQWQVGVGTPPKPPTPQSRGSPRAGGGSHSRLSSCPGPRRWPGLVLPMLGTSVGRCSVGSPEVTGLFCAPVLWPWGEHGCSPTLGGHIWWPQPHLPTLEVAVVAQVATHEAVIGVGEQPPPTKPPWSPLLRLHRGKSSGASSAGSRDAVAERPEAQGENWEVLGQEPEGFSVPGTQHKGVPPASP